MSVVSVWSHQAVGCLIEVFEFGLRHKVAVHVQGDSMLFKNLIFNIANYKDLQLSIQNRLDDRITSGNR